MPISFLQNGHHDLPYSTALLEGLTDIYRDLLTTYFMLGSVLGTGIQLWTNPGPGPMYLTFDD